jgi:hypothetical protein
VNFKEKFFSLSSRGMRGTLAIYYWQGQKVLLKFINEIIQLFMGLLNFFDGRTF